MTTFFRSLICLVFSSTLMSLSYSISAIAATQSPSPEPMRIVSLSPHLTELVYAVGAGEHLVATSDHSDYPEKASKLPSIASYQGANIAEIVRLQPSHVLVWRGGNKDADIQKLSLMGFNIHESRILTVNELVTDIVAIGQFLAVEKTANRLAADLQDKLAMLKKAYLGQQKSLVYYMSARPLLGLGSDPWLNDLLQLCGLNNLYANSLGAYPALQMADIVRQNPDVIIAAGKYSQAQVNAFWEVHKDVMTSKLIIADPDALHRFTPRSIDEIKLVCERAYQE